MANATDYGSVEVGEMRARFEHVRGTAKRRRPYQTPSALLRCTLCLPRIDGLIIQTLPNRVLMLQKRKGTKAPE